MLYPQQRVQEQILKNSYHIVGDTAYIQLTQGQEALIDVENLERVLERKWYALWDTSGQTFRAVSRLRKDESEKPGALYLHRFLLASEIFVDHENRNPLDNRKCNLRAATRSENAQNAKRRSDNTGYKGVSFNKRIHRFQAQIYHNRKQIYLGSFLTAEEAYETYCKRASELHKEFACLA